MNKIDIDRWIERLPDEKIDSYIELLIDQLSDQFYEANEDWILESTIANNWYNRFYDLDKTPKFAAEVIERAFKIYRL